MGLALLSRLGAIALLTVLVPVHVLEAQLPTDPQPRATSSSVSISVAGSFSRGGLFVGTAVINRFEARGNNIVAIGFVRGILTRGGRTVGTGFAGPVLWPVVVNSGGITGVAGNVSNSPRLRPASFNDSRHRIVPVQAATCPVVQVALGAIDVNLLGVAVALPPIGLDLNGEEGTPLGDLVCSVSDLLGNVAALVDVLNGILGLLTGLLGGLTGGLV